MIRLPRLGTNSPIGLDLGSHSFHAVQLRQTPGGTRVLASASLPRTKAGVAITPDEILRLQGVLDRRGFVGRQVVLAVPANDLLCSILELPARAPGVPLEQIAVAEFSRINKVEPAAVSFSSWELPPTARASRATYMMAVGAAGQRLDAQVDLVETGRFDVVAVDDPYSATARGALGEQRSAAGLHAVVDLGWDAARLAIVHSGTVVYTRKFADAAIAKLVQGCVEDAGADATEVQSELCRFGLNPSKDADLGLADQAAAHVAALLKEIVQTFNYAAHQYPDAPMHGVLLCGGGSAMPGIAEGFTQTLGTPANVATNDLPSTAALAKGLALWEEAA